MDTYKPFRMLRIARRATLALALAAATLCAAPGFAIAYCGDANNDQDVTAVDALVVLRNAVGIGSECDGNCECDVDFDREITASDALATLRAAVEGNLYSGCGYVDACFYDEDCDLGYGCGTDPDWSCDAACVPE